MWLLLANNKSKVSNLVFGQLSSALGDSDWLSVAPTGSRLYMLHINLENHRRGDVLELEPCGKPPKKPINNSFLLGTLRWHATFYVYSSKLLVWFFHISQITILLPTLGWRDISSCWVTDLRNWDWVYLEWGVSLGSRRFVFLNMQANITWNYMK